MKKYHFIALAVSCGFLWACHKDGPTENPFADAPWAIDETLPVPIQVTARSTETKADAITALDANTTLQVLAYDTSRGESSLMYGQVFQATNDGGTLSFGDTDLYYPFEEATAEANRINYSFFAYYAPGASGAFDGVDYIISFPFNPATSNNDILAAGDAATDYTLQATHGRYTEGTTYHGFNGRYARVTRLDGNLQSPALSFTHCAARIIIKVKADPDDSEAASSFVSSGLRLRMTSLTIEGAYQNAKINLRDALSGTPEMTWDTGSTVVSDGIISMLDVAPWVLPTAGGVLMHTDNSLFIVPGDYQITVDYQRAHFTTAEALANNTPSDTPVALPSIELTIPSGGYLAGHTYVYNVSVLSESAASISASLVGWDAYPDTTIEESTSLQ